jgi:hypothetical protein
VYNAAAPFVPSPPFYVRFMVSARFSESVTPSAGAADALFATVASDRTDTRGSMRVPLCDMVMPAPVVRTGAVPPFAALRCYAR